VPQEPDKKVIKRVYRAKPKFKTVLQNLPNTACIGQVRAFAHTFREAAPNGGFGVWWLCPPNPALAGNACR